MQDNNQFYTVMWKKNTQTYWQAGKPFKQQLKSLILIKYIFWIKNFTISGLRRLLPHVGNV